MQKAPEIGQSVGHGSRTYVEAFCQQGDRFFIIEIEGRFSLPLA